MAALSSADETEIRSLYRQIVENWNNQDAQRFGALFVDDGESVGFDGSQLSGPELIAEEMRRVFSDHATGRYVAKIQGIRALGDAALLRALAGMVPAGASDLEPKLNVVHTLIAKRSDGRWRVGAISEHTGAMAWATGKGRRTHGGASAGAVRRLRTLPLGLSYAWAESSRP
jgi:uncharacterized protein (TIGR02246 family)